ncbi:hypothetical protein NEUTE1DRAFT_137032 [Neurospora tetrasperma FGSC 2508]|uniref:Uncharacterized protein n=1 Tax=Neurospora tetrasperma (strain FGSC 2508 / ATCC MYA-4615 / P0657) TaxID=510951 RepID=F8MFF8_NEUT8|nr:uncharacterized protein NEUTE1DRAFT_137032 [Neurospora tetrasperma FGSC 2508]EGO60012.1 hypothetical protein NEUTE1DRAFT_137032 [Neurospora tetrasperma FGSC 2508]EGZ74165.1 hypothetical protein NEUTE2DRAFT_128513 [Neurospora tetrasperma FGSC 2509]
MASPQDMLTRFLGRSVPGTHIAHLQGPHGCGKSTQWLCRIWDQIAREPTARLVYIQPTATQAKLLTAYLSTQSIKDGLDSGRVMLFSIKEMVKLSREPQQPLHTRLGPRTTVCIDLEVTPSARGEYLVAFFHDMAEAAGESLTVITMGAANHRYPRCARPVIIQVDPPHELLPMAPLRSGVHASSVIWDTLYEGGKAQDRNVLLFTDLHTAMDLRNSSSWENYETRSKGLPKCHFVTLSRRQLDQNPTLVASLATLKGPTLIQVEHDVEVRFPIRNVAMAVYQTTKEMTVLDNRSGLLVKNPAVLISKQELLAKQGLATYSCGPAQVAHYIAPDGPICMDSILDQPRPHAHSSELLAFCLLALSIPTYDPLAYNVCPLLWYEALRVVKLMGLVNQTTSTLTPVGLLTLEFAHQMSMSNIYPAAFIAHMHYIPASPATKRVACMMAAILHAGQDSIWHPPEESFSAHQFVRAMVAQSSPSFTLDRLWSGSLWVAVALLEEVIHTSKVFTTPRNSEHDRWPLKSGCSFNDAAMIYRLSTWLAQSIKSPGPLDRVDPDDQPEVLPIQRTLLSAYAQNVVFIPSVDLSRSYVRRDIVSFSSCQPLGMNVLDLTSLRPYAVNHGSGFLGLFTKVDLDDEANYAIQGTMPLKCEVFDVFQGRIPGFQAGAELKLEDLNKLIAGLMTVWGREVMVD